MTGGDASREGARPACSSARVPPARTDDGGFTVIEALIAMAILAVSSVTLIGVAQSQITRIDGLETRTIGLWIAENRLAELSLTGLEGADESGATPPKTVSMLGRDFEVRLVLTATDDPGLSAVTVTVVEAGTEGPASVLGGFTETPGGAP